MLKDYDIKIRASNKGAPVENVSAESFIVSFKA